MAEARQMMHSMERRMARERVEMERRLAAEIKQYMAADTERRVTEG